MPRASGSNGLIQPITVRPNNQGFEIVAGARRFRAAKIAELFSIPARIVEITDAQAVEWQLVENSMRADVHPYEEAQGFQRLLDMPGYDVATLVEKSGKSASHIYARLSLLQLIPEVAEAFVEERITASHANLIARLPQESQAKAFAQCWRKDWNDAEAHLLTREVPFFVDTEQPLPRPCRGAFRPRGRDPQPRCRSLHHLPPPQRIQHRTLFRRVSDECLDGNCYRSKISAHLDREIAAHPEFVQIETSWRNRNEQRPGVLERGEYEILDTPENPDAEPPCPFTRTALIVYGKRVGTTVSVCTEDDCPVHNPTEAVTEPVPSPAVIQQPQATPEPVEEETEEEATERQQDAEQLRKEFAEEQQRKAEERRREFERQQEEHEAERAERDRLQKARIAEFDRILDTAPAVFSAAQFRLFLRLLVNLDPYTFVDEVAEHFAIEHDDSDKASDEILLSVLDALTDDKLTGFALRLVLTQYHPIPREGEIDVLSEVEAAFAPSQPKKVSKPKKPKTALAKVSPKKNAAKKSAAA